MDLSVFQALAESWRNNASSVEGYKAITDDGETPLLMPTLSHNESGDLVVSVIAVRDIMKMMFPDQLLRPEDVAEDGIPRFPISSITLPRNNS